MVDDCFWLLAAGESDRVWAMQLRVEYACSIASGFHRSFVWTARRARHTGQRSLGPLLPLTGAGDDGQDEDDGRKLQSAAHAIRAVGQMTA